VLRDSNSKNFIALSLLLKGMSHQFEACQINQTERKRIPAGGLLTFQMLRQSLIHIEVLPVGLQQLEDSQITSGDCVQTLSNGYLSTNRLKM
jgi:hypothetical protein